MSYEDLPNFPPRFDSDLVRPYWEAIKRGEMTLPVCSQCGQWQWYPHEFVTCHPEADHRWVPVSSLGSLYTFTRVHRSFLPNSRKGSDPYVSVLIEPDGTQGVRIPSILINSDDLEVAIGMRVELTPVERDGYWLPAYSPLCD